MFATGQTEIFGLAWRDNTLYATQQSEQMRAEFEHELAAASEQVSELEARYGTASIDRSRVRGDLALALPDATAAVSDLVRLHQDSGDDADELAQVDRVRGRALGKETPIGWTPHFDDINWKGLDFPRATFDELQTVDRAQWKKC